MRRGPYARRPQLAKLWAVEELRGPLVISAGSSTAARTSQRKTTKALCQQGLLPSQGATNGNTPIIARQTDT